MKSNEERINRAFVNQCATRLDAVEATLAVLESSYRSGMDCYKINQDLTELGACTHDIAELRQRVQDLGQRYAALAFSPAPPCVPKYQSFELPVPSIREGAPVTPISDQEAAKMIADLYAAERRPIRELEAEHCVYIGGKRFIKKFLAYGLIARHPEEPRREKLRVMALAIIVLEAQCGLTTNRLKQIASALESAFPEDKAALMRRFESMRRELVRSKLMTRIERSAWKLDTCCQDEVTKAVAVLNQLEMAGADASNFDVPIELMREA